MYIVLFMVGWYVTLSYEITSPTEARNGLFKLLEKVVEDHQVMVIKHRQGENKEAFDL